MGTAMRPQDVAAFQVEDPLAYLPLKTITQYQRDQIIFDEKNPPERLYLVVQGRVKLVSTPEPDITVALGIVGTEQFFGTECLLGLPGSGIAAVAIEPTKVMSWSGLDIEMAIAKEPRLGIALMQTVAGTCIDMEERLQSLAIEKTPERVARAILNFTERVGELQEDGAYRLAPLTHELIAQYIGTTREIVTCEMGELRRRGIVNYTRKRIVVNREPLKQYLTKLAQGRLSEGFTH